MSLATETEEGEDEEEEAGEEEAVEVEGFSSGENGVDDENGDDEDGDNKGQREAIAPALLLLQPRKHSGVAAMKRRRGSAVAAALRIVSD